MKTLCRPVWILKYSLSAKIISNVMLCESSQRFVDSSSAQLVITDYRGEPPFTSNRYLLCSLPCFSPVHAVFIGKIYEMTLYISFIHCLWLKCLSAVECNNMHFLVYVDFRWRKTIKTILSSVKLIS